MRMSRLYGCIKTVFALLLTASLLFASALAEGPAIFSTMLHDWLALVEKGEAVDVTLSAALHELTPYGKETVEAMNRLLAQCKLKLGYWRTEGTESTRTQLLIGEKPALDFLEAAQARQTLAQTSLLPGVTLASTAGSPLEAILGEKGAVPSWLAEIPDPNALSAKISSALAGLAPLAREKKASYSIASVGTAKKALIYTVPEESAQLLRDLLGVLANELPWPDASSFLRSLAVTGDAVITLYQSAEGVNMGLGIKATMGFESGTPRKVAFMWGFTAGEIKTVHTLSLKAPAVKGGDALTVTGKLSLESKKAKNFLSLTLDIKNTLDKKTDKIQLAGKLDCLLAEDNQRIEGEIKRTHTNPEGIASILAIKPSLTASLVGDDLSLNGSARIVSTRKKAVQADVVFSLLTEKASGIIWEDTAKTVSLDGIGKEELSALAEKAQEAAVKAIWRAVLSLPEDCLTLISKDISQKDWERIYQDAYKVSQ